MPDPIRDLAIRAAPSCLTLAEELSGSLPPGVRDMASSFPCLDARPRALALDLAVTLTALSFVRHLTDREPGELLAIPPRGEPAAELLQELLRLHELHREIPFEGADSEDPAQALARFYEYLLNACSRARRRRAGVFCTPGPLVDFIVGGVDELLRTELGLSAGLAETATHADLALADSTQPFLRVLDPAVGTGLFLESVIDRVCNRVTAAARQAHIGNQVLPHLVGCETALPAWALAVLMLNRKLAETGYRPSCDDRLRLYLTSGLQSAPGGETGPFSVVLGNPPYSNYGVQNRSHWIRTLLEDYKRGLDEKKLNLDDDFVKFVRAAQWHAECAPAGVVGLVTNNVYLDGLTHRRMRCSLQETFHEIRVVDLHGNAGRRDDHGPAETDQNVFEIGGIGAAVSFLLRKPSAPLPGSTHYCELWGSRQEKLRRLATADLGSLEWNPVEAVPEQGGLPCFHFFTPRRVCGPEYEAGWSLTDIFRVWGNGIKTDRDALFVDFDRRTLGARMRRFYSEEGVSADFRAAFRVEDTSSYPLLSRRARTQFDDTALIRCLYRPFDVRWIYYAPGLTSRPAQTVMRHMLAGSNLALLSSRMVYGPGPWRDVLATSLPSEFGVMAARPGNSAPLFPLYVYQDDMFSEGPQPNFTVPFLAALWERVGPEVQPESVLCYIYAVLHSPSFRESYEPLLKIDFPRIPLPPDAPWMQRLARLGRELVELHARPPGPPTEPDRAECEVAPGHPKYRNGRIHISADCAVEGVEADVWQFQVGGYQVCRKWLRDRRGRALTSAALGRYRGVIDTIRRTLELMSRIDELVTDGWCAVFEA